MNEVSGTSFSVALFESYFYRKGPRKNLATEDQMVVTPVHPGVKMKSSQMNDVNTDYANRSGFHETHNMGQSRFK